MPIYELRQYTLHPGARETLIELFDREFVETQEAVGIDVIGQFRALDAPDRFVWLRAFPDMSARARSLAAFYDGPLWAEHRDAANATMVDSDDVLLLRPAWPGSGFALNVDRPPVGSSSIPDGLVVATIHHLASERAGEFSSFIAAEFARTVEARGGSPLAVLATEHSPNNFPRLPIREGEEVVVSFAAYADDEAQSLVGQALGHEAQRRGVRSIETLRLTPTARSRLAAIRADS